VYIRALTTVRVLKIVREKSMGIVCHKGLFGRSAEVQNYLLILLSNYKKSTASDGKTCENIANKFLR